MSPSEIVKAMKDWTGLTQEKFAKSINYSKRTINYLGSGDVKLTVETLLNIANTHGFNIIIEKNDSKKY